MNIQTAMNILIKSLFLSALFSNAVDASGENPSPIRTVVSGEVVDQNSGKSLPHVKIGILDTRSKVPMFGIADPPIIGMTITNAKGIFHFRSSKRLLRMWIAIEFEGTSNFDAMKKGWRIINVSCDDQKKL